MFVDWAWDVGKQAAVMWQFILAAHPQFTKTHFETTGMLGSIVSRLASPTAHGRKILVEKNLKKKIENESELPRNHVSGGPCHGQPDGRHGRVTRRLTYSDSI